MRQGRIFNHIVMLLLAAGLAVYFGAYLLDSMYNPFSTTVVYTYTHRDSVEVEGVVVREEYVLAEQTGIVEASRREGERVGSGQIVALVHRDSEAQQNQAELSALENEISVLYQVLGSDLDVLSAARHDESILTSIIALRGSGATQSLSSLDEQVVELKSLILQRDYAYGDNLTQTELTLRLNELVAEQKILSAQTGTATQSIYAPMSGLYSGDVDGYESVFTVDSLSELTAEGLQTLLDQTPDEVGNVAGKLILGSGWYLALSVPYEATTALRVGDKLSVGFGGEFATEISMTITQMGDETEGDRLVVLYSDRYMSDTTLLRQTSVELIYDTNTGLRVPKAALRMVSSTDSEGNVTQTVGVYAVVAGNAEFQPITVLAEGEDFYVVSSVRTGSNALRAGDEIIVYGVDLYDGKQVG